MIPRNRSVAGVGPQRRYELISAIQGNRHCGRVVVDRPRGVELLGRWNEHHVTGEAASIRRRKRHVGVHSQLPLVPAVTSYLIREDVVINVDIAGGCVRGLATHGEIERTPGLRTVDPGYGVVLNQ